MKARTMVAVLLPAVAGMTVGCTKKVELIFNNITRKTVEVQISAPGVLHEPIGTIPPTGQMKYVLKIDHDFLPASCSWRAGGQKMDFVVNKDTPSPIYCDITTVGPQMRDKDTEIKKKIDKKKKIKVYEGPIID